MPDLRGRETYEDELATALLLSWGDAISSARSGKTPNWRTLQRDIALAAEPPLVAVGFAAANGMMRDAGIRAALPETFVPYNDRAKSLAQDIVGTRRERFSVALADEWVDSWMSAEVADSIAVTEVTGSISVGEQMTRVVLHDLGLDTIAIWNIDPRSNVCEICRPLHTKEEPFWIDEFPDGPPAHPRCLLGETPIRMASLVSIMRAKYHGPVYRITCATGGQFTVTPKHMLLSPDGFVYARSLNRGDNVIRCLPVEVELPCPSLGDPNDEDHPSTVEEIFNALAVLGRVASGSVPVTPEYFHGDGVGCYGNVDVVRANGLLRFARETGILQPPSHSGFVDAARSVMLKSLRNLEPMLGRLGYSSDGGMGGFRELKALLLGHLREAGAIGGGSPSKLDALLQDFRDVRSTDARLIRECQDAFSGRVLLDEVVDVEVVHVDSFVYDVQTTETMYTIANDVASSNCRCFKTYKIREF